MAVFFVFAAHAQTTLKKVYDENINPLEQIEQAVGKAKTEGNFGPVCDGTFDQSFVYIHVNYDPRKAKGEDQTLVAKQMLERLNHPARFGFPVFVILDEEGKVIHIQDSSFLEEGQGYSQEKVLRFFNNWTPKAVNQ